MADPPPGDPDAPPPIGIARDPRRVAVPGEAIPAGARRTLARAPGERYDARLDGEGAPDATVATQGSAPRAVAAAIASAVIGAVVLVVVASPLAISEPLVLVALATGVATGFGTRWGSSGAINLRRRRAIALGVVAASIVVANLAIWQLALGQGGVLPFTDYIFTVFGPVAPLELVAGALAAWATA